MFIKMNTCTVTVSTSLKENESCCYAAGRKEAHFFLFPLLSIAAEINALHHIVNDGATWD